MVHKTDGKNEFYFSLLSPLKDFQSGAQLDFKVIDQIMKTKDNFFDEICLYKFMSKKTRRYDQCF